MKDEWQGIDRDSDFTPFCTRCGGAGQRPNPIRTSHRYMLGRDVEVSINAMEIRMFRRSVPEYSVATVIAVLTACVMPVAMPARAQSARYFREFSADYGGSHSAPGTTSRIYVGKNKQRTDVLRNGEVSQSTILDFQNQTGWLLRMPEKTAMDMSAVIKMGVQEVTTGAPPNPNDPCAALKGSTCRKLGTEDVNGRHTQKWEMKDSDGKAMTVWIDPTLPLAVKMQSAALNAEFRNIQEGPQPESLFQVPSDFRKMPSPFSAQPQSSKRH